jgi:hypothetical protein
MALGIGCQDASAMLQLVDGATVNAAHINVCALGEVHGIGSLWTDVTNGGVIQPKAATEALVIAGNYVQQPSGTFHIQVVGPDNDPFFGRLNIAGTAALNGKALVSFLDGVQLEHEAMLPVLNASAVSGGFAMVSGTPSTCGMVFKSVAIESSVFLQALDELALPDCNNTALADLCDLHLEISFDCNQNLVPDECDAASGSSNDCNANAVLDECKIASGQATDCNGNTILDTCDLTAGTSVDLNFNLIPDDCESFAPGDIDGNGIVDVDDLLHVIDAWGLCRTGVACPADMAPTEGNGLVDIDDLLVVIDNWS